MSVWLDRRWGRAAEMWEGVLYKCMCVSGWFVVLQLSFGIWLGENGVWCLYIRLLN